MRLSLTVFELNNIIYTTLCKMQQIYYIHIVVQMQLISYNTVFPLIEAPGFY